MSERISLLRRPRPPKVKKSVRIAVPLDNIGSPLINDNYFSMENDGGGNSPVPTMRSDYQPFKQSQIHKKILEQLHPEVVSNYSDRSTQQSLVVPYKPRGPEPFPIRLPRQPLEVKQEYILPDDSYYNDDPEFCFEDFRLHNKVSHSPNPPPENVIISRENYVKLIKELQNKHFRSNSSKLTKISFPDDCFDVPQKTKRIPKRQILLEIEKAVRERIEDLGLTSPSHFQDERVDQLCDEISQIDGMEVVGKRSQISILRRASTRVFKEAQKSHENKQLSDESMITPSELSILNCLMDGGFILSMKAHFSTEVPDLFPLHNSLIYLNLSFNELSDFPMDILNCSKLTVLKFRDNPLRGIPSEISKLKSLRTLIISFCCLTSLPVGLFSIKSLEYLDVSYNKLTFLPTEIRNLENLRFLNVEGNELPGLPCGLLRINLFRIRIKNNFMNPVFWIENSRNSPQRLSDVCCHFLKKRFGKVKEIKEKFPEGIAKQLNRFEKCDCCMGPLYGPGLRIIRPCTEIWKIRRLPFIFRSCSPACYQSFIKSTDPKIADLLYGVSSNESL